MKKQTLILYVVAFALITGFCLLAYGEAQQVLRQGANDPQIQMAEDAAAVLRAGRLPNFSGKNIDIASSLDPYLIIFDSTGKPIMSDGLLDGKLPSPPGGLFDYTKQKGEYIVTWQPRRDARQALVMVSVGDKSGRFVAAGRSMREVEKRESQGMRLMVLAWAVMQIVAIGGIYIYKQK